MFGLVVLPVNTIHRVARAKKPTVASVAFVYQRITPSSALDHGVEVPRGSLGRVVLLSSLRSLERELPTTFRIFYFLYLLKYVVFVIRGHEGDFGKSKNLYLADDLIYILEDLLIVTMLLSSGISFSVVEN